MGRQLPLKSDEGQNPAPGVPPGGCYGPLVKQSNHKRHLISACFALGSCAGCSNNMPVRAVVDEDEEAASSNRASYEARHTPRAVKTGERCKRTTCRYAPFCAAHRAFAVDESTLPGAGKGIFASRPLRRSGTIGEVVKAQG